MRKRSLRHRNHSDVPTSLLTALVLVAFIITCVLNYAQHLGSAKSADGHHHAISFLGFGRSSKDADNADLVTHGGGPQALEFPLWWAAPFYSASGESCTLRGTRESALTPSVDQAMELRLYRT